MQSIYFGLYKTALDVCCTAANLTIMKQIYTIDDKISIIVLKYLINYVILMLLKKSKMEPAPFYSLASQRILSAKYLSRFRRSAVGKDADASLLQSGKVWYL